MADFDFEKLVVSALAQDGWAKFYQLVKGRERVTDDMVAGSRQTFRKAIGATEGPMELWPETARQMWWALLNHLRFVATCDGVGEAEEYHQLRVACRLADGLLDWWCSGTIKTEFHLRRVEGEASTLTGKTVKVERPPVPDAIKGLLSVFSSFSVITETEKEEEDDDEEVLSLLRPRQRRTPLERSIEYLSRWLSKKGGSSPPDLRVVPYAQPATVDPRVELQSRISALYAEADELRNAGDRKAAREKDSEAETLEAELAALSQAAPAAPDPRVQLTDDLEKAKAQKAEALANEDPEALGSAKREIARIEAQLAALSAPAIAATDPEVQDAKAWCESTPQGKLPFPPAQVLAMYRQGSLTRPDFLDRVHDLKELVGKK